MARRNARERSRVKSVNQSYEHLRVHVPAASRAKKISKVDIIKHSIEYIQKLRALVESCDQREWESYEPLAYPLKAEPHTSSYPSSYPPTSPTSPTSVISQESGYASPQGLHFKFPPSYPTSCASSPPSYPTSCVSSPSSYPPYPETHLPYPPLNVNSCLKPEEDDMILDVILDWQKS